MVSHLSEQQSAYQSAVLFPVPRFRYHIPTAWGRAVGNGSSTAATLINYGDANIAGP
jgi:hypothetical protein